jgi:transposase InsO family protein
MRCCLATGNVPDDDRDGAFGPAYTGQIRTMGIRDHPTAPRSPWQNGHAECVIGSIRRECLDHTIVFGEAHLRRILKDYAGYYNRVSASVCNSLTADAVCVPVTAIAVP